LGELDRAVDVLETIVVPPNTQGGDRILEPFYTRAYMRVDPNLNALHGNPRFEKLTAAPPPG
jgi:hypothetical protein